jgi:hypothetical protein
MGLKDLPRNHTDWLDARAQHVQANFLKSAYTSDFYK